MVAMMVPMACDSSVPGLYQFLWFMQVSRAHETRPPPPPPPAQIIQHDIRREEHPEEPREIHEHDLDQHAVCER
jgi:hypothetical protein